MNNTTTTWFKVFQIFILGAYNAVFPESLWPVILLLLHIYWDMPKNNV